MKKFSFLTLVLYSLTMIFFEPNQRVKAQEFEEENPTEEIVEDVVRENLGIRDFIEGVLATVPVIIDKTKDVVESINAGDIEGAIDGTLGAIGLLDPQESANNSTVSSSNPYGNPTSTTEAEETGQAADGRQSQTIQNLSQIVFGEAGQEVIEEQNQVIEESQEGATLSQEAIVETHEVSEGVVNDNLDYADEIANEASEARAAKASQDVLKAIANQNEYEASILAGISEQIGLLNESQAYNAVQMKGLNTQLTVLNQREQNMQTYFAAQGLQLSEIDNNLEQQIQMAKYQNNQTLLRSQVGMTKVFIPGLFSEIEEESEED